MLEEMRTTNPNAEPETAKGGILSDTVPCSSQGNELAIGSLYNLFIYKIDRLIV